MKKYKYIKSVDVYIIGSELIINKTNPVHLYAERNILKRH